MSGRPAAVDALAAELEPDPLDAEQVIEGDPQTSDLELSTSPSGEVSGVWRCTPGRFRDTEVDETFVVLEGRATVEFESGEVIELAPGMVCTLPAGAETVWTVHETLLKGYRLAAGE